ncbi:MAG: hypothetical protein M3Y74_18465, partial [Chloroflexota bacterium]|nr:hypothetical protein [Chloroflexota bacterium]
VGVLLMVPLERTMDEIVPSLPGRCGHICLKPVATSSLKPQHRLINKCVPNVGVDSNEGWGDACMNCM